MFDIESFDHTRTNFLLDGAHIDTECSACHLSQPMPGAEPIVQYRPVATECEACHAAGVVD